MFRFLTKWFGINNSSNLPQIQQIADSLGELIPSHLQNEDVIFLCIGTPRVSGDSFGPLVGSFLQKNGYSNVYGTLDCPVDAKNLEETLKQLPSEKKIIAFDAALGGDHSVLQTYVYISGPLCPGTASGKNLPCVGDYGIMAVIAVKDWRTDTLILFNTPISMITAMAAPLAIAVMERFPLPRIGEVYNIFAEDAQVKGFIKKMQKNRYTSFFH